MGGLVYHGLFLMILIPVPGQFIYNFTLAISRHLIKHTMVGTAGTTKSAYVVLMPKCLYSRYFLSELKKMSNVIALQSYCRGNLEYCYHETACLFSCSMRLLSISHRLLSLNVRTPQHVYTLHGYKVALAALCHDVVTPI